MSLDPAALARQWARELPVAFAYRLADALRDGPDAVRSLRHETTLPSSLGAVGRALELVQTGRGSYASGALTAYLDSEADRPTVTPVWTGPESTHSGGRLTLAVLVDLISEAHHDILLVSYATYPSDEVRAALAEAVARGVELTTLLERPADNAEFSGHGDPLAGIRARRFTWLAADRPAGASMHAKVLIVDRCVALVGSANLTSYGLERNLECGLLIRGGPVPAALADHLLHMRDLRGESEGP